MLMRLVLTLNVSRGTDSISSFSSLFLFIKCPSHCERFSLCSCIQYNIVYVIKLFLISFLFIFYAFILDYISIRGTEPSNTEDVRAFSMFCSCSSEAVCASRCSGSHLRTSMALMAALLRCPWLALFTCLTRTLNSEHCVPTCPLALN